ncbi:hypothetical protein M0805_000717 [Coniferiporia weirii]|nr:hypothetical protein M0805_000717 [Coniferiporia weirii]
MTGEMQLHADDGVAEDEDGVEGLALDAMFTDPPRPPSPSPTISIYTRSPACKRKEDVKKNAWSEIEIRLVGSHPLWGHYLWNAARAFATYLDTHEDLYLDKNVLELGAGGGLPGLVTALNGARKTVLTDYPDQSLLENLSHNVEHNVPTASSEKVVVQGYIWGAPTASLFAAAPEKFDLIILSDLVFNHSQHDALLKTCDIALKDAKEHSNEIAPSILVFYTHHRPHLSARDLDFFTKARSRGWVCVEIVTERYPPMFPDDPGEEEVRATVHGWRLTRAEAR